MITVSSQQNKKKQFVINDSILESLRSLGSGVGRTLAKDVAGKIAADAARSVVGQASQGELKANRPVEIPVGREIPGFYRPEAIRPEIRLPYRPVIENGLERKIEGVRIELAQLAKSMASLNLEVQKAVSEIPVNPGVYHLSFFERLRTMLVEIRKNIDDSRTWLATWHTRKSRMRYWGMYKKHGTSFGLSHERSVATQAG
ncbi:hypothetical protein A2Z33_00940 [Candidatus Gottesmanbacteria bacterium RBG_16_52_11]|uniref:DUF5660 domain-containing protein n=1 Tax=Candidatus Gottesmanbacteria bacterium RBG_16_52_11 TaxID=1798374 RepID=A0A1F5YNN2_9BACT|nr:MAG: hypothetical protein A2Z33_00940 [Candidatus Gottesmanbacteria bacterium RBG_16_52_11]